MVIYNSKGVRKSIIITGTQGQRLGKGFRTAIERINQQNEKKQNLGRKQRTSANSEISRNVV